MDKELPCSQFLVSATNNQSNDLSIKFTEAARLYLEIKGKNRGFTFEKSVQRVTRYIISSIGDKDLASYTRANANSFRHSLRDRLRYVACPSEITDQIGGWSNKTVGQNYGSGYRLCDLNIWMQKLV